MSIVVSDEKKGVFFF